MDVRPADPRPAGPRLEPVSEADRTDEMQSLLDQYPVPDGAASNLITTFVRHPGLFRRWWPFTGKLLVGKLPARDRELMILRTAWLCRSGYEWGQHEILGRAAGIGPDDLRLVTQGPDAPGCDPFDAVVLRAVDELHESACLSDQTWSELAKKYDERQLIEVPMLVGQYHLLAFTLNSLGVQPEEGINGLPRPPA
jgi:4-carboxymuconolactone decarboxylase